MTAPLRVLHLENEPRFAEIVRSQLQRAGLAVEIAVAPNLLEYQRLLPTVSPDLIISDFDAGGPVGFEALELARQSDPDVPFIILSGSMDEQQMVDCLKRGASAFVHKTRSKDLVPAVHRLLDERAKRRQSAESLRSSEERFQLATKGTIDGLWDWNLRTNQIFYSARWKSMLGYTEEEITPTFVEWESRLHPDDHEAATKAIAAYLKGNAEFYELEHRLKHKDGTYRWILARGAAIRDEHGEPIRMAGSHTDITERKRQEELLRESEAQLRQAQKMDAIGRLAGGVAHDFNNILTAILGYSELAMMRLDEGHPAKADIEEIRKAGERASALTRQLLAFSRKQVLQQSVINLNTTLLEMDKMLRRVIGETIDLRTVTAPNLGRIKADPSQLEQVILNLALNARDAMPSGGRLTIETSNVILDESVTRRAEGLKPGAYVQLSVTDTGVGMDEQTLAHVFEPFFTTKEKGKGTGLGLSTVFGIVKQSAGIISVASDLGQGTSFKIHLRATDEESNQQVKAAELPIARAAGETILVVEDEPAVRQFLCTALRKCGFNPLEVMNAEEGLALLSDLKRRIDLIVTDMAMPGMGGKEMVERIRRNRPQMRVLYLSGYSEQAMLKEIALPPGTAFLEKPISTATLAGKVRELLK